MRFDKIKYDYLQYGFWGFLMRILKYLLRKLGIYINSYYYMINHIEPEFRFEQFKKSYIPDVKILGYQDFLLGDKDVFTESKLSIIRNRLSNKNYIPYGIVRNNRLIYSCWVSLRDMVVTQDMDWGKLKDNEALLVDDYCCPSYRGKGIHTAVNTYRLWNISQMGRERAVVIILRGNKPAYRSQLKAGFDISFSFIIVRIWGKTFTNYWKKYNRVLF